MTVKRLTKRMVDSLQPAKRDLFVWDCELAGFGLKLTPAGRRIYVVQYRLPGVGRRMAARRFTLGEHGPLTVDEARKFARKVLNAVAEGRDPAQERSEENRAPTVADVASAFLADVQAKRKSTTYYEYARHFTTTGKRTDTKLRGDLITHFGASAYAKSLQRTLAYFTTGSAIGRTLETGSWRSCRLSSRGASGVATGLWAATLAREQSDSPSGSASDISRSKSSPDSAQR